MLPFVVPTLVAALGVLALWGPRGLIGAPLAEAGLSLEDSPWLLLYGNLFFNLCLVVRAGVDALERVSAQRVAAARTLGATPWRAFWRVEWPAVLPWLASALCLVFLYCFAGFGLALILGAPVMEPAGKQASTASAALHSGRSWALTVLTSWCTVAYDSTANSVSTTTLPSSATRLRSLRMRSTIITFSARSLGLFSSSSRSARSACGVAPRGRVPLIGLVTTRPDADTERKTSGEELSSAVWLSAMNAP
jgi:ABC-type Fe3+ transport system permease subunit